MVAPLFKKRNHFAAGVLTPALTKRDVQPPLETPFNGSTLKSAWSIIDLPSSVSKPCNVPGLRFLCSTLCLTALSLRLSVGQSLVAWLAGQGLLAISLLQWFVILHECGHNTLFRHKGLNVFVGHLASVAAVIPFLCWKPVHRQHHKWTGWRDRDPTTALLLPDSFGAAKKWLINFCWRLYLPLFSIVYRIQNYWNYRRLTRIFGDRGLERRFFCNICGLAIFYAAVVLAFGMRRLLEWVGLGMFLNFIIQDLVLLSQHTHMPLNVSNGAAVRPYPLIQQAVFTRSLKFPAWFSTFVLLNFDAHELHHMYPFVPGYFLRRIPHQPANEINWWRWVREAKKLRGEIFLLQNREQSGVYL